MSIPASAYGPEPEQRTMVMLRCETCGKLLAEVITVPFRITCPRCKAVCERLPT